MGAMAESTQKTIPRQTEATPTANGCDCPWFWKRYHDCTTQSSAVRLSTFGATVEEQYWSARSRKGFRSFAVTESSFGCVSASRSG